ncbi:serine threonine-prot [Nannochloropsis gaditana]|uniref:Serine threonine-prot n=1 Tax=Nannochloropsis gaditana TaxID=72520 RepID=W7U3V6_9STRA|nr:serine threonine-prot [Nannochloropsis gaditana]
MLALGHGRHPPRPSALAYCHKGWKYVVRKRTITSFLPPASYLNTPPSDIAFSSPSLSGLPEPLALHYTLQMLRVIRRLWVEGGMLHCDIRCDNFLMVGQGSLMVIDLGVSLDVRGAEEDQEESVEIQFLGGRAASGYQCRAMRAERSSKRDHGIQEGEMKRGWREDADLYALGASAYCLLHGHSPPSVYFADDMKGNEMKSKKAMKPTCCKGANYWRLKRYWEQEAWTRVLEGLMGADIESLRPTQAVQRLDELCDVLKEVLEGPKGKGLSCLLETVAREMGPFLAGVRAGRL